MTVAHCCGSCNAHMSVAHGGDEMSEWVGNADEELCLYGFVMEGQRRGAGHSGVFSAIGLGRYNLQALRLILFCVKRTLTKVNYSPFLLGIFEDTLSQYK